MDRSIGAQFNALTIALKPLPTRTHEDLPSPELPSIDTAAASAAHGNLDRPLTLGNRRPDLFSRALEPCGNSQYLLCRLLPLGKA